MLLTDRGLRDRIDQDLANPGTAAKIARILKG